MSYNPKTAAAHFGAVIARWRRLIARPAFRDRFKSAVDPVTWGILAGTIFA